MKIRGDFVLRKIGGENILVPVGTSAMEFEGLITVDEVGMFIWNLLEKEKDKDTILQQIVEEYDVEQDKAEEDLTDFLADLFAAGLLGE